MWYTSRSGIIHGSGKESMVPEGLVKNGRTSWTFGRRDSDVGKIRGKRLEEVSGSKDSVERSRGWRPS